MNDIDKRDRILVIDDNRAIHEDYRKSLFPGGDSNAALSEKEAALFDVPSPDTPQLRFEIRSAYQGQEGVDLLHEAASEGRPYAMAFIDVRMPPGMDGIETAIKMWETAPDLQVVICTAYADYSWNEMIERLGRSDRWVILKKPFEPVEVLQLANALT
jgi:CheY-like chemotaxis protein